MTIKQLKDYESKLQTMLDDATETVEKDGELPQPNYHPVVSTISTALETVRLHIKDKQAI